MKVKKYTLFNLEDIMLGSKLTKALNIDCNLELEPQLQLTTSNLI